MKMSLQKDATLRVLAWKPPYYFAVWTHGPDRNHLSPPSDVIIDGRSYNANTVFISINRYIYCCQLFANNSAQEQ